MFCAAALGDLLRCLRVAGLDAEGTVVKGRGPSPGSESSTCSPEPALVRMGGAYLAELVALALDKAAYGTEVPSCAPASPSVRRAAATSR